jgi:hypothetical protein
VLESENPVSYRSYKTVTAPWKPNFWLAINKDLLLVGELLGGAEES